MATDVDVSAPVTDHGEKKATVAAASGAPSKKTLATWKKQLKNLKTKDASKKIDGLRYCAQDERFFREQAEVLPLLIGFLSRVKMADVIAETLRTFKNLFTQTEAVRRLDSGGDAQPATETAGEQPVQLHPEENTRFVVDACCSSTESSWKGLEPFVALLTAAVAPEIKLQTIEVFSIMLRHTTQRLGSQETTDQLRLLQTSGSPATALLSCLTVENNELPLAALHCISLLFQNPPDEQYLTAFHTANGVQKILQFTNQPERRFHRPMLETLEIFSHHAIGRSYLLSASVPDAIKGLLASTMETTTSTLASATTSPATPITLSADEAAAMHGNVSICSRIYARTLFANDSTPIDHSSDFINEKESVPVVIYTLIALLQREIKIVVSPPPAPPPATGNSAAAQAAAAAALATANTLAALFPFSSTKCVDIVTSLGRMIENSDACKQYAKSNGLLPVLLTAYKVPGDVSLHQSVDKLLHLCATVENSPILEQDPPSPLDEATKLKAVGDVDPQLFSSVPGVVGASTGESGSDKPAFVTVESVLSILESSLTTTAVTPSDDDGTAATAATGVVFRLVRWLAFVVDAAPNAQALGEPAMAILVKILLETKPDDLVLSGFLCKCIQAIAIVSPEACELCSTDARNPISALTAFLHSAYPPVDPMPSHHAVSMLSEVESTRAIVQGQFVEQSEETLAKEEQAMEMYKLEWLCEFDEPATFEPQSLTRERDEMDPFLYAAKALQVCASTYSRANPTVPTTSDESDYSGTVSPRSTADFAELLTQRIEANGKATSAATANTTSAASKKKQSGDAPTRSLNGEGITLCVLEKALEVFKLLCVFCSKNGDVAVSLMATIKTLSQLPGGVAALLLLAKTQLLSSPTEQPTAVVDEPSESSAPTPVSASPAPSSSAFPWTRQEAQHTAFTYLLAPIFTVFESRVTCFFQIEAAVAALAAITADSEHEPTVAAFQPMAGSVTSTVEIPVRDADRFLNVAICRGVLVHLLAALDSVRVPQCPHDSHRRQQFTNTIMTLVLRLIDRGNAKQTQALARKQEIVELHDQLTAAAAAAAAAGGKNAKVDTGPVIDIASVNDQRIEYKQRWACELLDAVVDVPRYDYRRVTPLLLATQTGQNRIANALLEAGAAPDGMSSLDSTTPLMLALLCKNHTLVQALLHAGAKVDAITRDGYDVSVWCCVLASPVRDDLLRLISHTHTRSTSDQTPMEALVALDSVVGAPDVVLFETLLRHGLDVNVSNADGDFVLHALLSQYAVRKKLRGVDLCFRYSSSRSLDADVLRHLVGMVVEQYNGDIDACNKLGQTPLHVALLYGHGNIAQYLIGRGANPNVRDSFGFVPLHYACLGFFNDSDHAIQVIEAILTSGTKHELKQGAHNDRRKYKTLNEKAALDIEMQLDHGFEEATAPTAITRTLSTVEQMLTTSSAAPDGFAPWHLACGGCCHLNASNLCLSDEMSARFVTNGHIRAAILEFLVTKHQISLETRTAKHLTGLQLAIKTDVDGCNASVMDVILAAVSSSSPAILNAVHEPTLIDTLPPVEEGSVVEVTTDDLLYVPDAHVSTRSLQHRYHVILPDGMHLDNLDRHQLKASPAAASRYVLRMEGAFSALHYALQSSDDLARKVLALAGISLQPEGSDLPLLALACAARRAPDVIEKLVNPQVNVRVHLPLHDGTSHEQTTASQKDPNTSGASGGGGSGGGGGTGRAASRKQAAALHYAVIYEDASMVRALVEANSHTNVNVRRSGDGFTPLHLACEVGNMEIIKLLLDHGANFIQMSTVSSSSSGVTPLHRCIENDGMENENLKELINQGYVKREMLLEGLGAPAVLSTCKNESEQRAASGVDGPPAPAPPPPAAAGVHEDQEMEISCVLLDEEEHNLSLFNHVEQRLASNRGAAGYRLRLQNELNKSDEVLRLFFELISGSGGGTAGTGSSTRNRAGSLTLVVEEDLAASDTPRGTPRNAQEEGSLLAARHQFAQLKHWHECYAQQKVPSKWVSSTDPPVLRRSSFDRRSTSRLLELTTNDVAKEV